MRVRLANTFGRDRGHESAGDPNRGGYQAMGHAIDLAPLSPAR